MGNWNIHYFCGDNDCSDVEEWLEDLSKEQLKSIAKELKMLEVSGNMLRLPHCKA